MKDNRNSIYELDEKGDAYGNVYELRKVIVALPGQIRMAHS